jgi:hypothetical protein
LVICYALLGAVGSACLFYVSALPVTIPDDWPAQAPVWLLAVGTGTALVLGLPWLFLPIPLLVFGVRHVHHAPGRWQWPVLWSWAVSGAVGLEALAIMRIGYHIPSPGYMGPGIVSWVSLVESIGFVALGAAMIAVLTGAERAVSRLAAGMPAG